MSKSEQGQYGTVAVALHWLSALSLLLALIWGFAASAAADLPNERIVLLRLHALCGALTLLLTGLRVVWWAVFDQRPSPESGPTWQRVAARWVHNLFYILILTTATLGVLMAVDSGALQTLIGVGSAQGLADFWTYPWRLPHGIAARLLILLVVVHLIASVLRAVLTRGRSLARIWF